MFKTWRYVVLATAHFSISVAGATLVRGIVRVSGVLGWFRKRTADLPSLFKSQSTAAELRAFTLLSGKRNFICSSIFRVVQKYLSTMHSALPHAFSQAGNIFTRAGHPNSLD